MRVIKTLEDYKEAVKERTKLGLILIEYPGRQPAREETEVLDILLETYRKEHPVVDAKPCPFGCGSEQLKLELHGRHGYFIMCEKCKASGPYGSDQDEGVKVWNERE